MKVTEEAMRETDPFFLWGTICRSTDVLCAESQWGKNSVISQGRGKP